MQTTQVDRDTGLTRSAHSHQQQTIHGASDTESLDSMPAMEPQAPQSGEVEDEVATPVTLQFGAAARAAQGIGRPQSRRGFTRQPESPKRAHWRPLALQTPPKFNEKTPRGREKERKFGRSGRGGPAWERREGSKPTTHNNTQQHTTIHNHNTTTTTTTTTAAAAAAAAAAATTTTTTTTTTTHNNNNHNTTQLKNGLANNGYQPATAPCVTYPHFPPSLSASRPAAHQCARNHKGNLTSAGASLTTKRHSTTPSSRMQRTTSTHSKISASNSFKKKKQHTNTKARLLRGTHSRKAQGVFATRKIEKKDTDRPAQTTQTCHASFPLIVSPHHNPLLICHGPSKVRGEHSCRDSRSLHSNTHCQA